MTLKPEHRVAIFWGGGLGDILVLRPLLIGLGGKLVEPPTLFTTATHLPGLLTELGLRAELRVLPRAPRAALQILRTQPSTYDLLYLGPYPTLKTRLLATATKAVSVWSRRRLDLDVFVGEQVLADVKDFGLNEPAEVHEPYGGTWAPSQAAGGSGERYLVLHPGAKDGWKTKQWPDVHWLELMEGILLRTSLNIVLAGVPAELPHLERLANEVPLKSPRISIRTDLSLADLAKLIKLSAGVICHNSGTMHLSAMLGCPTLVLTGASAMSWRPPYAHVVNLTSGACNLACNQYRCPVPFYRARCIRKLTVESVMQAVRERLLPPG